MKIPQPLLSLSLILTPAVAPAQEEFFRLDGASIENLGAAMRSAGDYDGDGVTDLVVAADGFFSSFARVLSGADRSTLAQFVPSNSQVSSVDGVGDVNQDGYDDWIVGAPPSAFVFGGNQQGVLYTITSANSTGHGVAGIGDVDGDNKPDFLVARQRGRFDPEHEAVIHSGADASELGVLVGETLGFAPELFQAAALGDVNNDQRDDFLLMVDDDEVRVYSGATLTVLRTHAGPATGAGSLPSGRLLDRAGDLDDDGVEDYIVSNRPDGATVYSGASGAVLHSFPGTSGVTSAFSVAGAGDASADGIPDLLIASLQADGSSTVELRSGATGAVLYNYFYAPTVDEVLGQQMVALGGLDGAPGDDFALTVAGPPALTARPSGLTLHSGNDLFLNITPDVAPSGTQLEQTLREGAPGNPVLLSILEVNGVPVTVNLGIFPFDATGTHQRTPTVPGGFGGFTLTYRAFALSGDGRIIDSGDEVLVLP